jgi:uncharacterized protein YkwD
MRPTSAFVVYLATAVALLCPTAASADDALAGAEREAIESLNQIRSSSGLPRLRASESLGRSADAYSRHMLRHEFFGHQARIPVASRFSTAGETLAWHSGWQPQPRGTVGRWMASPPHRAVLLSRAFGMVGMGMERGILGGQSTTMWVAHFGRR